MKKNYDTPEFEVLEFEGTATMAISISSGSDGKGDDYFGDIYGL